MAKKTTIRCPHCGCEYLPAEIYYPNDFLGRPSNILRDEKGSILGFNGDDMNTKEEFTCESCGKHFEVDASITFMTTAIKADPFAEEDDF